MASCVTCRWECCAVVHYLRAPNDKKQPRSTLCRRPGLLWARGIEYTLLLHYVMRFCFGGNVRNAHLVAQPKSALHNGIVAAVIVLAGFPACAKLSSHTVQKRLESAMERHVSTRSRAKSHRQFVCARARGVTSGRRSALRSSEKAKSEELRYSNAYQASDTSTCIDYAVAALEEERVTVSFTTTGR